MTIPCRVAWCVAMAELDGASCPVHATRGQTYHPEKGSRDHCDACDGSGDCADCDGQGIHECEHANCYHDHECPTCDGTGECRACHPPLGKKRSFEEGYLAWAFDLGWQPLPPPYDCPWDGEGR